MNPLSQATDAVWAGEERLLLTGATVVPVFAWGRPRVCRCGNLAGRRSGQGARLHLRPQHQPDCRGVRAEDPSTRAGR